MKEFFSLLFLATFCVWFGNAQPMITKEVKVILIMDPDRPGFTAMELFDDQRDENSDKNTYMAHNVYIGLLKGGYELHESTIRPEKGSTITVYTDRQLYNGKDSFPKGDYPKGGQLKISKASAIVISNRKGELLLKIK